MLLFHDVFLDCTQRETSLTTHPHAKLSKNAEALQLVKDIMQAEGFYLYRGQIWFRHPLSRCTKVLYSTVSEFIGHLCANPENWEMLFDRMAFLTKLLSDGQCTIIEQLQIDPDTIEVCTVQQKDNFDRNRC